VRTGKRFTSVTVNLWPLFPTALTEANVNVLTRNAWVRLGCLVVLSVCGGLAVRAQQIGRTPIEVQVTQPPTAAVALGRVHLVYELHLTNFGAATVALEQLEVLQEDTVLANWTGPQLSQRIRVLGEAHEASAGAPTLRAGARAIAYLWLSLQPGQAAPSAFAHRLTFSQGGAERHTMITAGLSLPAAGPALAAPVRGGPWLAVRGPSNASPHRLAMVTSNGRVRVPQRFAVDWALLGEDGLLFRGEPTALASWYGYDAPVYAAADGVVALVRNDAPDHPAFGAPPPAVMEPTDATGNVIVLDIGQGRFATYAHLKSGSLRVSVGDRVVEGQLLARIGNSGNTLGPHLHFQLSDALEPLGGNGLPFSLLTFDLVGRVASVPGLLTGTPWTPDSRQPARAVTGEMPLENMVMRFSDPSSAPKGR
jgi:murein DD-endopeptidase